MEHDFWHNCWENNAIGFHQESLHPFIEQYIAPTIKNNTSVFIPLCGKSLDMLWWAERCTVIGSELSKIACSDFFSENKLTPDVTQIGEFNCFQVENLAIYQGDFFTLKHEQFSAFNYIYDRAAIIAMPRDMRANYVNHLKTFISEGTQLYLMTLEYPQSEHQGPPFTVMADEVKTSFSAFNVEELAHRDLTGKKFAKRSLPVSKLIERLFLITPKA